MTTDTPRSDFPNEAEASVLAYAASGIAELSEVRQCGLTASSFYVPARRIIFAELVKQADEVGHFDAVSISDALSASGKLENVGGQAGLADAIFHKVDDVLAFDKEKRQQRVQNVTEAATRRNVALRVQNALERLKNGNADAAAEIMSAVDAINRPRRASFMPFRKVAKQVVSDLKREHENHSHITGIRSGFFLLDSITAGFQPGNVYIVAARPSMGKTAFGLNIVQNVVFHPDQAPGMPTEIPHIAIVSAEMSCKGLFRRILASESQVDFREMVRSASKSDLSRTYSAARRIQESDKISVLEAHGSDIDEICTSIRLLHYANPIGLLLVDYLQLIPGTSERSLVSTVDAVSEVSGKMHHLAVHLDIPIIALAQLNRDATGKAPSIRDIKGSGSIEQDADVVILLDRPEKHLEYDASEAEKEALKGITVLDVAKNRNGETGRVLVDFDSSIQRFTQRPDQLLPQPQKYTRKIRFSR